MSTNDTSGEILSPGASTVENIYNSSEEKSYKDLLDKKAYEIVSLNDELRMLKTENRKLVESKECEIVKVRYYNKKSLFYFELIISYFIVELLLMLLLTEFIGKGVLSNVVVLLIVLFLPFMVCIPLARYAKALSTSKYFKMFAAVFVSSENERGKE